MNGTRQAKIKSTPTNNATKSQALSSAPHLTLRRVCWGEIRCSPRRGAPTRACLRRHGRQCRRRQPHMTTYALTLTFLHACSRACLAPVSLPRQHGASRAAARTQFGLEISSRPPSRLPVDSHPPTLPLFAVGGGTEEGDEVSPWASLDSCALAYDDVLVSTDSSAPVYAPMSSARPAPVIILNQF